MVFFIIFQISTLKTSRGKSETISEELNNFIPSNPVVQSAWAKFGDGTAPTLDKFAALSGKNAEFKAILESELERAGLLNQWQQFVTEYNRRQSFDMAAEVRQAGRNVTKAADQIQDNQEYADRLGQKLNRMVRPKKVQSNEFFNPKNAG